jgi:hypothetical protein
MSTASSSYVPRDTHQPRGKRPWCANCDTDLHLMAESHAVRGRRTGTLAIAVHCLNCRQSRVLDTTEEHLTALPTPSATQEGLVHQDDGYLHCGEPMFLPGPRADTTLRTFPAQHGPADSLAAYLATQVLRCRCGFQMELPR